MKRKTEAMSYDEVRGQVNKKYENRVGLIQHLAAYLIVNCILWILYLTSDGGFPWPLFATASWGIGMVSHMADYYYRYGRGAKMRDAEVEAEMARQRRHFADDGDNIDGALVYELDNVRQRGLRLSDDGELANVPFDDEDEAQEKGANH